MLRGLHRRSVLGQALALLALLAISTRALVAPGYMLSPAGPGHAISVTICTGHGQADIALPQIGNGRLPSNGKTHEAPCAFAAVAHLASPKSLLAIAAPVLAALNNGLAPKALLAGSGPAAAPPWSTGPPEAA